MIFCLPAAIMASPRISVSASCRERNNAARLSDAEGNEGSQAEGEDAYVAIAMVQEFAQFLERDGASPCHQNLERRAHQGCIAGSQRLPNRSSASDVAWRRKSSVNTRRAQQVGPNCESEEILDLFLVSGQHHSPAGGKAHIRIAVLRTAQQHVAGHAAAGLVVRREAEVGEGGAASTRSRTRQSSYHSCTSPRSNARLQRRSRALPATVV